MKLQLLNRTSPEHVSFTVSDTIYRSSIGIWHYHAEFEIIAFPSGSGTRFIGDSIGKWNPGDVFLLGKNLPHMWLEDETTSKKPAQAGPSETVAIHFLQDFMGPEFFERPELRALKKLMDIALRGIHFSQVTATVLQRIQNLVQADPIDRFLGLLEVLKSLASSQEVTVLASPGYVNPSQRNGDSRLKKINEYVFANFKNDISAQDVAQHIGMNASAFSRYFTRIHKKTFTSFLNEIRIGYACKQLQEAEFNISSIAYSSGFNNLSNFNKQFKHITGTAPSKYAKLYSQNHLRTF
jgi:AraC-like DNA-binding protein